MSLRLWPKHGQRVRLRVEHEVVERHQRWVLAEQQVEVLERLAQPERLLLVALWWWYLWYCIALH